MPNKPRPRLRLLEDGRCVMSRKFEVEVNLTTLLGNPASQHGRTDPRTHVERIAAVYQETAADVYARIKELEIG